jgi:hypothetical protein
LVLRLILGHRGIGKSGDRWIISQGNLFLGLMGRR